MGLLDDLRMSTGLALEPVEAYVRAFEKGVLLGPSQFGAAADLFRQAVGKLERVDGGLAARAAAHACVYAFLANRDPRPALEAVERLRALPYVEAPGTLDELVEGPKLAAEIAARIEELAASSVPAGRHQDAALAHWRAAYAWLPLGQYRPVTFAFFGDDGFTDDAVSRFFLHAGLAARAEGHARVAAAPEQAAEHYAMATQAFGRCGAEDLRGQTREALRFAQLERRCWFCGLRAQGVRTHVRVLALGMTEYLVRLSGADPDRRDSVAHGEGIFGCEPCATAIDAIAEARAAAVRGEMRQAVLDTRQYAEALEMRIRLLEARLVAR